MNKKRKNYGRPTVDVPLPGDEPPAPGYWYIVISRDPLPVDPDEMDPDYCQVCGCPPDHMPMVFRGTG